MARGSISARDYIPYPKAMKLLADRLGATPDELAVWIFLEPGNGGIAAFENANELSSPPKFRFEEYLGEDYLELLMGCWFRQEDVDRFKPADRYITGTALISRWSNQAYIPNVVAFIRAKVRESRLLDIHPTFTCTQWTHSEDSYYPPLSAGLFQVRQIEQVESEDCLDVGTNSSIALGGLETKSPASNPAIAKQTSDSDRCSVFRDMDKLNPSEITITILGDVVESGLSGNNMLEISARGEKRRVSLAEFDLVDRRRGSLNQKAAVLVGLAKKKKFCNAEVKNAKIMERLRKTLRERLGFQIDPFQPHSQDLGWRPKFAIHDHRGRLDERAKVDAQRRTLSRDYLEAQGREFANSETRFDFEDDDADKWLRANELGHE
ncbi:hypothetical protein [Haliea sp.]|uniref:hypothetical protein n=1 Tax=Haliea sp. TaxID=1932666 RepID=UPI003528BC53